jgi:large subunit ribosomal protein L31e
MAAEKKSPSIERTYTIPLRKEFMKVPRWRKTKKASAALKQFLQKHMKTEDVKVSPSINEYVWKHGIKNPPHHVKVTVTKDEKGVVKADLFGKKEKVKKVKSKND